jgi:serine protease
MYTATKSTSRCRRPGLAGMIPVLALFLVALFGATAALAQRPANYDPALTIEVRFAEDALPQARGQLMSSDLRRSIVRVERLFSVSEQRLRELRARGQQRSGRAVPALEAWYRIVVREGTDVDAMIAQLIALPYIEVAERAPVPAPPPYFPATTAPVFMAADHQPTPSFEALQEYLDPAPAGIDARYAWNFTGGNGAGFTVFDVEYNWNRTHEDLSKLNGIALLLNAGDTANDPFSSSDHGTAVMGELIADRDTKGVTGISWGADGGLAPASTANLGYNPANAIALSAAAGKAGDVILIEQQTRVCNLSADLPCTGPGGNCGPTEWIQSAFDAMVNATAAGLIVVQAAGNGGVDLDSAACNGRFTPGHANFQNSGAIIVGAGQGGGANSRNRLDFSTYGARVDLQGWGNNVMTTGYGTHYSRHDDPTNQDFWYRRNFNGTSSASPVVSGAVLNLQGISQSYNGTILTAAQVLNILRNTGSPQTGDTSENIGPLPDLRMAIAAIINVPPVADAGSDQTIECEGHDGTSVTLDGTGSFDDNGDMLTYSWRIGATEIATGPNPTVSLQRGVHVVTLRVTDPGGLWDSDTVTITIQDTTDPVVTLLGDNPMTLECGIDTYVEPGATILDICDPNPGLVIDASAVNVNAVGEYDVDYTGTDASANSVLEQRRVNVVDTTPPTITVNSSPAVFWSPAHDYRTLHLADLDIEVDDACDQTLTAADVVVVRVTSDEAENAPGNGDGNTRNDMIIGETCGSVQLRAERSGSGNGRVYTLHLALMDASGNVGTTTYQVHVPRDQRPGSVAVADTPVYTVESAACEPVHGAGALAGASKTGDNNVDAPSVEVPATFELAQNHPNPFNPSTAITFALPEASVVRLSVFNMLGQEVARLVDDHRQAGMHEVRFDASSLPSGTYLYTIIAGEFRATRTMVLVK